MIIGVFDSGIGGLSTLSELIKVLGGYGYYYYADNGNMPYGTKTEFEIYKAVRNGLKVLRDNSDVQVIACNTASTVISPDDAFLLRPSLSGLRPENTLIMATPATLRALRANELLFNTANTPELATLTEIAASLSFKRKAEPNFNILNEYIVDKLDGFSSISTVILGCSHYVFSRLQIARLFPTSELNDGNAKLCAELKEKLPFLQGSYEVKFNFSGLNENDKYNWLLKNLLTQKR